MSMEHFFKRLQIFSSIAVTIASCLVIAACAKYLILGGFSGTNQNSNKNSKNYVKAGASVSIPSVDWEKNQYTLVLALNTSCHFCTESSPFYRKLAEDEPLNKKIKLITVFPAFNNNGAEYLDSLKVPIHEVKQASFDSLGIRGTPTMILVNNKGVALSVWTGKISDSKEDEVLNHLRNL
jgi:thioredoxin-related protein